jgi:transcriptional regulator with XRE-family HTH domain
MDNFKDLRTETLYIRYLLWKEDADPSRWAIILRKKTTIPETRAKDILGGASLSGDEREAICEGFSIGLETLLHDETFGMDGFELARENIKFLVGRLPHGEGKKMAQALGVSKETISRWKNNGVTNKIRPDKILKYLGLDPRININTDPLFLSLNPVGKFAIKKWLMDQLESISSDELSKLFPALKKLLGRYEGN